MVFSSPPVFYAILILVYPILFISEFSCLPRPTSPLLSFHKISFGSDILCENLKTGMRVLTVAISFDKIYEENVDGTKDGQMLTVRALNRTKGHNSPLECRKRSNKEPSHPSLVKAIYVISRLIPVPSQLLCA